MSMLNSLLRKFVRNDQGASAIEFAIIAPVFFVLVFAIMEVSLYAYHRFTLRYVVFEATRDIQTGEIQKATTPIDAFVAAYCDATPAFLNCNEIQFDVRSFPTLHDVNLVEPEFDDDGNATNFVFNPGHQEEIAIVTATMPYRFNTPMLKRIFQTNDKPVLIVGYSITKNEPFGCLDEC